MTFFSPQAWGHLHIHFGYWALQPFPTPERQTDYLGLAILLLRSLPKLAGLGAILLLSGDLAYQLLQEATKLPFNSPKASFVPPSSGPPPCYPLASHRKEQEKGVCRVPECPGCLIKPAPCFLVSCQPDSLFPYLQRWTLPPTETSLQSWETCLRKSSENKRYE